MLICNRPNIQTYNRKNIARPKTTFGGEKSPDDWTRPLIAKAREKIEKKIAPYNNFPRLVNSKARLELLAQLEDETGLLKTGLKMRLDEIKDQKRALVARINCEGLYSEYTRHSANIDSLGQEEAKILEELAKLETKSQK